VICDVLRRVDSLSPQAVLHLMPDVMCLAMYDLVGTSILAFSTTASSAASRNSRSGVSLVGLAETARDVLAQLVKRVEAARLQRELVVEVG
jgi:hypothetical protein